MYKEQQVEITFVDQVIKIYLELTETLLSLLMYNVSFTLFLFSSSYSHLIQTLITYYHSFSLFLSLADLDILSNPVTNTIARGTTYTLTCNFNANPMVSSVVWYHNDTELDPDSFAHISVTDQSTSSQLVFSPLQGLNDSGEYTCGVSNGVINRTRSLLTLTVQGIVYHYYPFIFPLSLPLLTHSCSPLSQSILIQFLT